MPGRGLRIGLGVLAGIALICAGAAAATASVTSAGGVKYVQKVFGGVDGYERLRANCPDSTHVIGGGQFNRASYQEVRTYHLFPADDGDRGRKPDDAWVADLNTQSPVKIKVFAICADLAIQYRTEKFPTPNLGEQAGALQVFCGGERRILGGGVLAPRLAAENTSFPVTDDSWGAYVDSFQGAQEKTKVTAICGKPNTTVASMSNTVPADSSNSLIAECPGATHLYSGGQSNNGAWNAAGVNAVFPFTKAPGAPDEGVITQLDNNTGFTISATAYAVCGPSLN